MLGEKECEVGDQGEVGGMKGDVGERLPRDFSKIQLKKERKEYIRGGRGEEEKGEGREGEGREGEGRGGERRGVETYD